jgi:hypothetical protein
MKCSCSFAGNNVFCCRPHGPASDHAQEKLELEEQPPDPPPKPVLELEAEMRKLLVAEMVFFVLVLPQYLHGTLH